MEDKGFRQELIKQALIEWLAGAEKLIVLGVGNELRGDDAAGLLVAGALKLFTSERFEAVECGVSVEDCIDYAFEKKPSHLLIVDAFRDGEIMVLLDPSDLESQTPVSTHAIPLPLLLEALGKPVETSVKILGIGMENFGLGSTISEESLKIINEATEAIREAAAFSGLLRE
ncbi:MAG: hydrogenase maturation protease [Candidatus Brockarchaeota archaeon]|nr:hydrogenase maturation protease [Candidatus Brockarchaeota archaeon]MBO3809052.1 hydrogenase maturation protease [Candidatus Brockarchaeota archaeon]